MPLPARADGESHLADPRSCIYSLGVVFYQLLTGRLPYLAEKNQEYREEILTRPVRPPRRVRAVDEKDLPVDLPHLEDFKPHGRPEPPLDKAAKTGRTQEVG